LFHLCSAGTKMIYDSKFDEYSERMAAFITNLHSGSGKKLTPKEKMSTMAEQFAKDEMQLPGQPYLPAHVIEPGIAQLEALTVGTEWHMTIVDVKMTTTQTPQGKKSRFSAMVMVGNLKVRAGGHQQVHEMRHR
jgi:hypothetical protein